MVTRQCVQACSYTCTFQSLPYVAIYLYVPIYAISDPITYESMFTHVQTHALSEHSHMVDIMGFRHARLHS